MHASCNVIFDARDVSCHVPCLPVLPTVLEALLPDSAQAVDSDDDGRVVFLLRVCLVTMCLQNLGLKTVLSVLSALSLMLGYSCRTTHLKIDLLNTITRSSCDRRWWMKPMQLLLLFIPAHVRLRTSNRLDVLSRT